ncbi:DUF3871 family protein [bacterium]|nr:DUF3871 family protein [bacterium]
MEKRNQFITANTLGVDVEEIREEHVIPVHLKDNEPMISHNQFIDAVCEASNGLFGAISSPVVRVSHPIKGRVPEARNKPSKDLLPHEMTLFYERMAWTASFPEIKKQFGDETLELTIGGVKAYNLDNAYSVKGTVEHFKIFIGFRNMVCTNLCVSSDGYLDDVKARDAEEIARIAKLQFERFHVDHTATHLNELRSYSLSEAEFAHVLGRVKLFNAMPAKMRNGLPEIGLSDSQLNTVAEEYFSDEIHGGQEGRIDLWRMYNLLTSANKSSYIDTFLDRNVKLFEGIVMLKEAIKTSQNNYYLN